MDFMIPANAKLLVGNLYRVSDTRVLSNTEKYIAIHVPSFILHFSIGFDFALPKIIQYESTNLPIHISLIHETCYFYRNGHTDACENSFDFINNGEQKNFAFVEEVLEERKKVNPIDFDDATQKLRLKIPT